MTVAILANAQRSAVRGKMGAALEEFLESATLFGFFLILGAVVGAFAGMIGVGGGALLAPLLFLAFKALGYDAGQSAHVAVGTSLAIIAPLAAYSLRARRAVDTAFLWRAAPWFVAGGVAGGAAAAFAPGAGVSFALGVTAFVTALAILFAEGGRRQPKPIPNTYLTSGLMSLVAAGASAGTGLGGGALVAPLLRLLGSPSTSVAVGAAGAGVLFATPAALIFLGVGLSAESVAVPFSLGYINLAAVCVITPMMAAAAPVGAQLGLGFAARPPRLLFAFVLALVSLTLIRDTG
ncbi:MAG: TSUP family transporter [Neomegalonema sp.]|nr:TSUP family transporter [Neomegalonema sp.]